MWTDVKQRMMFFSTFLLTLFSLLPKNSLDPQTAAEVMNNIPEKKESYFGNLLSKLKATHFFEG